MVKLAVLISGNGSNLQAIINAIAEESLHAEICCVVSDHPKAYGLQRAKFVGIPTHTVQRGENMSQTLSVFVKEADYIILAGFLSILSVDFCKQWRKRIINLHPSLLPKYGGKGMYGNFVHQAVINNNEKESGATVHWVTEEIDKGAILLQESCPVSPHDTAATLAQKVHQIEHRILLKALEKLSTQNNSK